MKPVPRTTRCTASPADIFALVVGHDFFADSTIRHSGTRHIDIEAARRLWSDPNVRAAVHALHRARGSRPPAVPWAVEVFGDDG